MVILFIVLAVLSVFAVFFYFAYAYVILFENKCRLDDNFACILIILGLSLIGYMVALFKLTFLS